MADLLAQAHHRERDAGDEMIDLRLGDCLEVMKTLPDGCVDAVITDPPFNAGKEFDNDKLSELDFRAFCNRLALEFYRLKPKNIVVEVGKGDRIMRQELERYFDFRYTVCLNYTNSMRNGAVGYSNFGLALWFSNGGKVYERYKDRLDSALHNTKGEFEHPSPKEVDHYSRLVSMFSPSDGTVLDPFAGSGTTGISCVQTGRNFIGIEINPDYYDIARRRIEAAQQQLTLELV
jgi:site-specific DNA-methyltransferase (adenine-specific)